MAFWGDTEGADFLFDLKSKWISFCVNTTLHNLVTWHISHRHKRLRVHTKPART